MAELTSKQFLDQAGLAKVFQLICQNHYNKDEVDELIGGIDGSEGLKEYLKTSVAEATYAKITDLDTLFDGAKYEDSGTTKVINFYHGETVLATIDATDFIVDGMVERVEITDGSGDNTGKKVLKVTWNSASKKTNATEILLSEIFDSSLYYTKTETYSKTEVDTELTKKLNTSDSISIDEIEAIYQEVLGTED